MKYFMIFLILIGFTGTIFASDNQIVHIEHYQPDVELLPDNTVQYGESFTIHAWLPIYDDKPEELQYFVDVLDSENNQVDSTLWFAKEDFVYEFDTTHPAYHITKGGTYFIKIEKADQLQRTGSFYKTLEFKINFPQDNLAPLKQIKAGIDPQKVRCNHGLYRNYKTSDGTAFCASGYTISKLIHRDYAMNFDSVNSAVIAMPNSTVKEYCPSSQQLLQWGWYPYDTPPNVINTNIDLIYDSEGDSKGVEFTFDPKTDVKSMIWVFVECN